MNHLNEEQLIDRLFAEPGEGDMEDHLASCNACQERLAVLADGLGAARQMAKPIAMAMPELRTRQFAKRAWRGRLLLAAAAVFFLCSLLGLRLQIQPGSGLMVQMGLLGWFQERSQGAASAEMEARLLAMEQRLLDAVQAQNRLAMAALSDRLESYEWERSLEWGELTRQVESNLHQVDHQNQVMLAGLRKDVGRYLEGGSWKGRVQ
jgi:hypothetical protein